MMNQFDKICAVFAIPLGVAFMLLGIVGLFAGSSFNFSLPPILGAVPFFAGWAMCVTLFRFWRITTKLEEAGSHASGEAVITTERSEQAASSNGDKPTI